MIRKAFQNLNCSPTLAICPCAVGFPGCGSNECGYHLSDVLLSHLVILSHLNGKKYSRQTKIIQVLHIRAFISTSPRLYGE